MSSSLPLPSPAPPMPDFHDFLREQDDDDADTASQRSISLSSPPSSPRHSRLSTLSHDEHDPRQSFARSSGSYSHRASHISSTESTNISLESPITSAASSSPASPKKTLPLPLPLPTYPPPVPLTHDDAISVTSFTSTSSRKARPESLLVLPPSGGLILGIALVDFNHLVGPRIEYSRGEIFDDEEIVKILPFLALPDGAHLSKEDYTYFHLVPSHPNPTTVFGISCNQQIAATELQFKGPDVTRSTVQKAVVVLASKPVFGPIREKLRVVTTALFHQKDFRDMSILDDFGLSLEPSLRGQLTESGLYMGTSLRELVHTFRQRTLILVKALMLQKRIMFYGHPVERLCTYQYSLVSLLPGLLQTLDDCGSPPLAARAPTLSRPTSLKTSDHKSMMAFMGLPLDLFGKDAFFQPYLPLQQLDMIKNTPSWLCGCTNSIVTHQNEIDLLVNIETGVFEFRDPKLERSAGLTAADRKWMDDIVTDVNDGWDDTDPTKSPGMQFKGSDDYLRTKFEEYVSAALSSVKYRDFMMKGEGSGVLITGGSGGDSTSTEDFNPLWISEFKRTNAYDVWERTTDSLLFDIIEPRHPCNEKPSVVADIGLRLQEGIQELKLEQQLAPAREAVARTLATGSTSFFKAVEGVRGRWAQRTVSSSSVPSSSTLSDDKNSRSSTPVEVSRADLDGSDSSSFLSPSPQIAPRPFSLSTSASGSSSTSATSASTSSSSDRWDSPGQTPTGVASPLKPNLSAWSAGIGSFLSTRAPRFSLARTKSGDDSSNTTTTSTSTSPQSDAFRSPPLTATPEAHVVSASPSALHTEHSAKENVADRLKRVSSSAGGGGSAAERRISSLEEERRANENTETTGYAL